MKLSFQSLTGRDRLDTDVKVGPQETQEDTARRRSPTCQKERLPHTAWDLISVLHPQSCKKQVTVIEADLGQDPKVLPSCICHSMASPGLW